MTFRKLFVALAAAFALIGARPVQAVQQKHSRPNGASGDARAKAQSHRASKGTDNKRRAHPQKRGSNHDATLAYPQLG